MLDYAPYILLITLLFIGSLLEVLGFRKDQMKFVRWGILAYILLFVGLRFNTGSDWSIYLDNFNKVATGSVEENWEPGFLWSMELVYMLFKNYYAFQFLATFLLLYSLNDFFSKYSPYPICSLALFVFMFFTEIFMSQVRQSMALAIILLGSKYLFNKNFYKFLLVVLLACMFHISAVVALLLYLLHIQIGKFTSILLVLLIQFVFFYPQLVINTVLLVAPILPERLENLCMVYLESFWANQQKVNLLYYIASVLLCIATLFIRDYSKNKFAVVFHNALLVTFMIISMTNAMFILSRFQVFFYVFAIVAMMDLIDLRIKHISSLLSKTTLSFVLLLFYAVRIVSPLVNTNKVELTGRAANYPYIPYYNVLSHPIEAEKRLDWYETSKK